MNSNVTTKNVHLTFSEHPDRPASSHWRNLIFVPIALPSQLDQRKPKEVNVPFNNYQTHIRADLYRTQIKSFFDKLVFLHYCSALPYWIQYQYPPHPSTLETLHIGKRWGGKLFLIFVPALYPHSCGNLLPRNPIERRMYLPASAATAFLCFRVYHRTANSDMYSK